MKVSVARSHLILYDPMDYRLLGSSVPGILQATTLGGHSLLQGIFPTQGLNRGLLHCKRILYLLSHQGNALISTNIYFKRNNVTAINWNRHHFP